LSAATKSNVKAAATPAAVQAGEPSCLEVAGSRVYADLTADNVLVVRVHPGGDTPVAVYVDEVLVEGTTAGWKAHGRHRRPEKKS
jgi:hypothetical protein